jgi:hypothetical protein
MGFSPSQVQNLPGIGGMTPKWKADVAGNPFVNGDIVPALLDRRMMYTCPGGDTVEFQLPLITPANVGKRVGFYDVTFAPKNLGTVIFSPNALNSVGGAANGLPRSIVPTSVAPWLELESDGVDTWNVVVGLPPDVSTFNGFSP